MPRKCNYRVQQSECLWPLVYTIKTRLNALVYKGKHELFVPKDVFLKLQESFGIKGPRIKESGVIFGRAG
jgi:hypothetical protein